MLRFRRKVFAIAVAGLIGVMSPGCGEEGDDNPMDDNGDMPPPAELVGDWTFQSVTVDGSPDVLADVLEWEPGATSARIQFTDMNAYVYQEVNSAGGQIFFESGFIVIEADELELNALQDSNGPVTETILLNFVVSGSTLTLTETDTGSTVVFTLTM
ncbi:MAG TPA: hypothetical protein VKU85_19210 [bacterium]|nr:hypothetical protein [bacterium]